MFTLEFFYPLFDLYVSLKGPVAYWYDKKIESRQPGSQMDGG